MNRFGKSGRTMYQYAGMYFMVLLILSGVIMFGVLRFSADKMVSLETQNTQNSLQRAADILEKQYQTMQSIAVQISTQSRYHPNNINGGALYDIDLLEDFKQYASYSPLTKQNFLVYSDTDKIYVSTGNTSFFGYHIQANMGIPGELTAEMLSRIMKATSRHMERYGSNILIVFPISGFIGGNNKHAAMCFILTEAQIADYLNQMTVGLPEQYSVLLDGQPLLNAGVETDAWQNAPNSLQASSARGNVIIRGFVNMEGFHILFSSNLWLVPAVIVCLCVVLLIAFLLAKVSLYPMNLLIKKYQPESPKTENVFYQLDEILSDMDQTQSSTKSFLRDQLLNTILHGNYNEQQVMRWSMLSIVFSHPQSCVYLIDIDANTENRHNISDKLEHIKDANFHVYTTDSADEDKLVVIANYDDCITSEALLDRFTTVCNEDGSAHIFIGIPVDSPKRLSLSYMAALTKSRYGSSVPRPSAMNADQLADRLLTALETGDKSAMDSACMATSEFLSAEHLSGLLTKHHISELVSCILHKASERAVRINSADLNALVLLPDTDMVVSDLRTILENCANVSVRQKSSGDDTARLIVEYVMANAFDPDINLQDMSEEFGLNADYISSMIKKETGSAFKEYLTFLRICEAKRLLEDDCTLSVNDVALKVGYRKASNFSKKFKELTGLLPSQIH